MTTQPTDTSMLGMETTGEVPAQRGNMPAVDRMAKLLRLPITPHHRDGDFSNLEEVGYPAPAELPFDVVEVPRGSYEAPAGHRFNVLEGTVEVAGVLEPVDWKLFVGATLLDKRMKVFASGFGGFLDSSVPFGQWTAAEGGAIMMVDPARKGESRTRALTDPHAMHADVYEAAIVDATNSAEFQDIPNADQIDLDDLSVIMHSMGEKSGGRFIRRHRSVVSEAVHVQTVGGEGRRVGLGYAKRGLDAMVGDIGGAIAHGELNHLGDKLVVGRAAASYFLANLWQTGGEALSCMLAEESEHIAQMRKDNIRQIGVFSEDDSLVHGLASLMGIAKHMDHAEFWLDIGHLAPQVYAQFLAHRLKLASAKVAPGLAIASS